MYTIVNEKEIEKIVLEHMLKIHQLEEDVCRILRARISNLISRLLLKINENLKSLPMGKKYDGFYPMFEDLLPDYDALADVLEDLVEDIEDNQLREILNGLRTMVMTSKESVPLKEDNPIVYERMVMINNSILKIKQYYNEVLDSDSLQCHIGTDVSREHLINYLNDHVLMFFDDAMAIVENHIDEAIQMIAVLEEGRKYQTLALEQKVYFSGIAVIEGDLLEEKIDSASLVERVGDVFLRVKAIEEKLTAELEAHEVYAGLLPTPGEVIDMEEVKTMVKAHIFSNPEEMRNILVRAVQIMDESTSQLKGIIDTSISYCNSEIKQLVTRESSGFQLLSGQIVTLFSNCVAKVSAMETDYDQAQAQSIAEGIENTLVLKLESLKEMDTEYQISKKNLDIEMENTLLEERNAFLEQTDAILESAIDSEGQVLTNVQNKFKNNIERSRGKYLTHDCAYLSDTILAELRTFDELLEHSLVRLKELAPDESAALSQILEETKVKARDYLESHGIALIQPKVRQRFNGKRHEVMMAEKEEGYNKGEIIKTLSVGYTLGDRVLMRATVIAAR